MALAPGAKSASSAPTFVPRVSSVMPVPTTPLATLWSTDCEEHWAVRTLSGTTRAEKEFIHSMRR
jgi:hypothetical protein